MIARAMLPGRRKSTRSRGLPATKPVPVYDVRVDDGQIVLDGQDITDYHLAGGDPGHN